MDADTRTLIERTRQRREILNQRFAGMPEAAPRKRRTPVLESESLETKISTNADQDDSPKRQCLRDVEINMKPDTPAIRGVQSRIKDLKPGESQNENGGGETPTPRPRKSVSSPPLDKKSTSSPNSLRMESPAPSSTRKSRFAALAQNINNWEDDMSHHVIHKDEEKKPRWQPPQNIGNTQGTPKKESALRLVEKKATSSPVKPLSNTPGKSFQENRCASPAKTVGSPAKANKSQNIHREVAQSPKKTRAPPVPQDKALGSPVSALSRNSPLRTSKVEWNRSPKPFSSTYMSNAVSPSKAVIKPVASPKAFSKATTVSAINTAKISGSANEHYTPGKIPVNAPGLLETPPDKDLNKTVGEPTLVPVSLRFEAWNQRMQSPEPSKQPLSTKLASFEQKISQNTPRHAMAGSLPIPNTPKQTPVSSFSASTPASGALFASNKTPASSTVSRTKGHDPSELPVSQRMSQMQEQLVKKHQDEPTAYSVTARMSAWEDMTSANKVCDMKKVDPSQTTPFGTNRTRPTSAFTPKPGSAPPAGTPKSSSAPVTLTSGATQNPPPPPAMKGNSIVPSKSLKETIEAKAAEVSRRTGLQYTNRSPVKPKAGENLASPNKAVAHSPKKVSAGTRGVQQLLAERCQGSTTTCSQMAAQSRAARAAELAALSNRFKNGILRDDALSSEEAVPPSEQVQEQAQRVEALTPVKDKSEPRMLATSQKEALREKARADFNSKLAAIEMDVAGTSTLSGAARIDNPVDTLATQKVEFVKSSTATASIYSLIKKRDEATPPKPEENKRVKFNDSFDDSDDEPERKIPKSAAKRMAKTASPPACDDTEVVFKKPADTSNKEDTESVDDSNSDVVTNDRNFLEVSDDDISLRGFVSEATRRESIFGRAQQSSRTSGSSLDSYGCSDQTTIDNDKALQASSDTSPSAYKAGYQPDDESQASDEEDDSTKRKAVNDLLDDAFDDTMDEEYDPDMDPNNVVMRKKQPRQEDYDPDMDINNVVMRQKSNYTSIGSTDDDDDDDRPYSLAAYRKSATINQHMMAPVVRSSKYVGKHVEEENIPMPYTSSAQPHIDDRRAVQDRIKELKELVQQEQSVIMQTSNALNKCCVGNPMFAGSSEQVECNRVLLLACQKRQCYMTEIERLKATGQLSAEGPGPQGSLTISDIRLPLKRDFVTKIGTSHDTTTHYFILLIRNGAQLICTQMLSTHDPMMRGSLDFPNLIKINGITGNFKLTLDIYGMNVSREPVGKDKKKKTPKKQKGLVLESPGGPRAVRTTSFSHVTSLELTRKMLDKSSFHLERLSYLSPLYGQIYMRLKCLMESNVEERGFLTMFDDVSGFGAWHRRWCVLTGNKLCIWKYPDDEARKDPMAVIDLKRCVSEKVGLVSRDICARPNTFELVTVRQPLKGEHDTLITRTYKSTTTVKYLMSADSKEERIVWCNKVNRTLANLRTWNADALKPMRPPGPHSGASSSSRR